MKKLILLLSLFLSISCFGQNKDAQKDISDITFYGTDFSMVKVYGAKETTGQFIAAFEEINNLFITEPRKYNINKYFRKGINGVETSGVKARIDKIDGSELVITGQKYELSENDIRSIIKNLSIKETKGTGLIFVAELLDKASDRGYYHIVFFDTQTRNIIDTWKMSGKAKGFGLRNYWAGSIYDMMKKVKM